MPKARATLTAVAAILVSACYVQPPPPQPPVVGQYGAGPGPGQRPYENVPAQPGYGQSGGRTGFSFTCDFPDAWVAVVPAGLYKPEDQFAMQALIGFTTEPEFWHQQADYSQYANYAAQQCSGQALFIDQQPGEYVIMVGWAGRGDYRQNGYLEQVTLQQGAAVERAFTGSDLTYDWPCISCPYLMVWRGGRPVEVGNVLIDRYSAARAGTDVVRTEAEVRAGRVALTLSEREPELSRIDAVEVRAGGHVLRPVAAAPRAITAADGAFHTLSRGDSIDLAFAADGLPDGPLAIEVRVTGWYQPMAPLR